MVRMGAPAPWKDGITSGAKIYLEGTRAVARYGHFGGVIDGPSADHTAMIQAAVDSFIGHHGSVFIEQGLYNIVRTLVIPSSIQLFGVNPSYYTDGTYLRLQNNTNDSMFRAAGEDGEGQSKMIVLRDMTLNGNRTNQTIAHDLVDLSLARYSQIKNLNVYAAYRDGLVLYDTWVNSCYISQCGRHAILAHNECFIEKNWITDNVFDIAYQGWGIGQIQANNNSWVWDNEIYAATHGAGLSMESSGYSRVGYNRVAYNDRFGISLLSSPQNVITNNTLWSNGRYGAGNYSAIRLSNSSENLVSNNECFDTEVTKTQTYGIEENGSADYNSFVGNHVRGNDLGAMLLVGDHSWAEANMGYNPVGPIANPYAAGAAFLTDSAGTQAFPSTATNYTVGQSPKFITVYGGNVTSISIDGTVTGLTAGGFYLSPGQVLRVVWVAQPSSVMYGV